jgi:hypothetical protein
VLLCLSFMIDDTCSAVWLIVLEGWICSRNILEGYTQIVIHRLFTIDSLHLAAVAVIMFDQSYNYSYLISSQNPHQNITVIGDFKRGISR